MSSSSPQRISQEVLNAANPFSNFNRFNRGEDDDDDENYYNLQQHQQQRNQPPPASSPMVMSPKKAAEVAKALALTDERQREMALRRLYGDAGVFSGGDAAAAALHRPPPQQHQQDQHQHQFDENDQDADKDEEATSSSSWAHYNLPGGAGSLDELLSRAAALDRECFDLQNEVVRWEKEIDECSRDINRVNGALNRYSRELAQVEQSVAELNGWFDDHTCANDPERYERLSELNRDVCGLNMRIKSLESQLSTLLEGTMLTASLDGLDDDGNSDRFMNPKGTSSLSSSFHHQHPHHISFLDGAMNNDLNRTPRRDGEGNDTHHSDDRDVNGDDDDDTSRMARVLKMVSPSSASGAGSRLATTKNQNDGSNYKNNNNVNNTKSHLVPVASPIRLPQNASTNSIKKYIGELEQKTLEQDVLVLRLKEAADKRDRLLDQERQNEVEIQHLRQKLESAGIALPHAPIQHRTSRAIRRNQAQSAAASSAAALLSCGSDLTKRVVRLPSGILRELTKELHASVRQVAHRCGVGEIAVEIANDATLLHCRGIVRAVNAFEDEVVAAADRCKRNRALGGMVTYSVPQVAAVVADATNKIAALLQPDTYDSPEKKSYW